MTRRAARVFLLLWAGLCAQAVAGAAGHMATAQTPTVAPLRTPEQLASDARDLCVRAQGTRKPLLLTFGADWCPDCRMMSTLARRAPLASALRRYERLDINVGRFDRHTELTSAWGIRSIATWVVVTPDACSRPVTEWTRVDQRTLEPATGDHIDPAELSSWLRRHAPRRPVAPP